MLKRAGMFVFLAGILLALSVSAALAVPGIEFTYCDRADGSRVYVRYDYKADNLAVWNAGTGEILFIIDSFPTEYINLKAWSNDCRYLFGQDNNTYAVWDVVSGGRAFVNTTIPYTFAPDVFWDNPQYIAFGVWSPGNNSFYVWDLYNNRTLQLVSPNRLCLLRDLQWVFEDGVKELWGRAQCNADLTGEILGFSLVDGSLIGRYPSLLEQTEVEGAYKLTFELDEDRNFVTVAPFTSDYVMVYRRDGTLLGNLHTFHTYLERQAVSPDGRYYVVAQNQLRVWDFASLNLDTSKPNYTWAGSDRVMLSVKFIDNVTIEVTLKGGIVQRWNILTGAQVG